LKVEWSVLLLFPDTLLGIKRLPKSRNPVEKAWACPGQWRGREGSLHHGQRPA